MLKKKASQISVAILTKNEVDTIERCLKSVEWCDDIILVDNSDDDTVKLARSLNPQVRVYQKKGEDFSVLRNFALTKVRADWVLFLDADEVVSQELASQLTTAAQNSQVKGYYLVRQDYFLGRWLKHGETANIRLLKFAKKSSGHWVRRVHEVWQINGPSGELTAPLLHYPHPTIAEFIARINRWTTLDAAEFLATGEKGSAWKIAGYPAAKFMQNYFLRVGFLDGMPGLIVAICMSFHSFLTRAKLYKLSQKITP